ncbi:MAG: glycosyltransferase family 2 protein [Anaerolineae bacterium]|nr:glycosyltransferase family 2 protein [Anaerolineae bacterium]
MTRPCSIVIPNFNGLPFLERCIPSLLDAIALDGQDHEVIVVDNGSSDGSAALLSEVGGQVRPLLLESNLGFARACNIGARTAAHDLLLFLNNDMYFAPGFIAPLLAPFDAHSDLFAVGAQMWNWQGQFQAGRVYGRFLLGSFEVGYDRTQHDRLCYTLYTSGAASAVHRARFKALGGFDESLYIYEDVDLGYRAWKRGWRVFHQPESIVYHKGRATSHQLFSRHRYLTINLKNRYWFIWKNLTDARLFARYLALLPLSLSLIAARARSYAPFLAFATALGGARTVATRRTQEAALSVRSDADVIRFVRDHVHVE